MSADQQLMDEYIRIVNQIEVQPRRELLERLFGMADQNFPPAMHTLSVCFERGIGLVKDEDAAFQYCLAAAKLGNPAALNNMGCNYFEGKHVGRDPYRALAYFNSAAKAGYVQAAHSAGYLLDVTSRTIIWPLVKKMRVRLMPLFHGLHRRTALER